MKNELTPERITELALANGFKLKEQPDGVWRSTPTCSTSLGRCWPPESSSP
jgi:hypothetical protein